ncbi:MAG TPA: 50S ribosomal protein L6 [Nitrospiria bacterium]|nr:50S ribosomal protein L6 [Nitrospiria bacterium]
MSRIGAKPIAIPKDVKVTITQGEGREIQVQGPKGRLARRFNDQALAYELSSDLLVVKRVGQDNADRAMHGMVRSEIINMIQGVAKGYERKLEISGVGFKVQQQGKQLNLTLGYSHPVIVDIPAGIEVAIDKQTALTIRGANKHLVGQFAANVRSQRPPEPYQGKGIKYQHERIRRKEGKKSK